MATKKSSDLGGNVEGILRGLGDLLGKLGELAEKGEQLRRSTQFEIDTGAGDKLRGVYGFSLKTAVGGGEAKVEPFGNIRRDERTGQAVVHETIEPLTDVFEEEGRIKVVAEVPGVSEEDVKLELAGDVLTLHAENARKKYHKELLLPRACDPAKMSCRCRNGVLEITLD